MPRVFSKKRKKSSSENNLKKYLKYAFGEIILVVIGILIALSINRYSENVKSIEQEKVLLTQVKKDVTSNLVQLESMIENLENKVDLIDTLLSDIRESEYDLKIAMTMGLIHRKSFFNNCNSSYKLISSGYATYIRSPEILNDLLALYEIHFDDLLAFQSLSHNHIENRLFPQTNRLFRVMYNYKISVDKGEENQSDFYEPLNYSDLKNNYEYTNTIHQFRTNCKNRLIHSEMVREKIVEFLDKLQAELE